MNQIVTPPLHGEVLGPCDSVRIVAALHPFRSARVEMQMPAGLSIAEMIAALPASRIPRRLHATIDGDPVPPNLHARVRPKAGHTVTLIAVPQGGKAGIGSILMIVVAIAALVIAPYLAGALFPGLGAIGFGVAKAVIGAAITIGGGALICATFPSRQFPISAPQVIRKSS